MEPSSEECAGVVADAPVGKGRLAEGQLLYLPQALAGQARVGALPKKGAGCRLRPPPGYGRRSGSRWSWSPAAHRPRPKSVPGRNQGRGISLHPIRGQLAAAVADEFLSAAMGAEMAPKLSSSLFLNAVPLQSCLRQTPHLSYLNA